MQRVGWPITKLFGQWSEGYEPYEVEEIDDESTYDAVRILVQRASVFVIVNSPNGT